MNKKIPMYKRVGAMALCLALLCGVIVGTGAFPNSSISAKADAAANVEKFEADFADLAALVGNDQWNASTNRYRPAETDTAIQNWINARFGLYICREGGAYKTYSFLGQSSFKTGVETSDGWSGEYWWEIAKDGGLYSYTGGLGGQMLRKSNLLALKYADGELMQLSNFEANVVFNKADSKLGSVYLSFHQAEPGRMNTNTNTGTNTNNGTVAIVGNGPLTKYDNDYQKAYKDGLTLGSLSGKDDRAMELQFANDLELNVDYNLYVKVVGTKMTTKVTKVSDGSVVYSGETEIPEGNGYISVGTSNDKRVLKKIQVTELNSKGEPVNLGSTKAFKWTVKDLITYTGGKYQVGGKATNPYYDFVPSNPGTVNNNTESQGAVAAIDKNFDVYYNCEGQYHQMNPSDKTAYAGQSADYGWFRTLYINKWLQRPSGNTTKDPDGNAMSAKMRLITTLVPKVDNKALTYKNFEATMEVRFNNIDASFVIGFRQQAPGKFVNGANSVNKDQAAVILTKSGISVAGGDGITDAMYNADVTKTFDTALSKDGQYKMTVRAVGDQVYVAVTSLSGSTVYYEQTHTVDYTKAGYLALGVANKVGDLGDITLVHLDENGNKMAVNEFTEVEQAVTAEPWTMSFTDIPGATYTGGVYTQTNKNWIHFTSFSDTQVIDQIKAKVDFYYNHEGSAYGQVAPYGNAGGSSESGNWCLFYNNWLQRANSQGWGERLRQINSIVPKDGNGVQAQMKNLSVSFEYRFEGDGDGAALFGFRQKNPGKFVNGFNKPNQEQALVAITRKSIAVAGGTDITQERFYHYNQFADDACGDVFSAELPQQVTVKIEAVGKNVSVKIYDFQGTNLLYSGTFEVNYTKEGYMAFGVSAVDGNFGDLKINRLDDGGNAIDFTDDAYLEPSFPDGKTRFNVNFKALSNLVSSYSGNSYVPTANDTEINTWLLSKFGMYGMRETSPYAELSYPGQLSSAWDGEADSKAAQWKIMNDGGMYVTVSGSHGEMLRKHQNLVPKLADGSLAQLKNFEAEVVFNKGGEHSFGAMYISFRETIPGKFGFDWKGNCGGDVVDGVIVGNGDVDKYAAAGADGITAGNLRTNNNKGMRTKFSANLDNSADYKLWVKVVGTKLEWSVTKVGETTAVASGVETIEDAEAGYISIGARNREIKSILITELDKTGKVVNFGTAATSVAEKWYLSAINLAEYKSSKYTATYKNADGSDRLGSDGKPLTGTSYYNFVNSSTTVLDTHPDAENVASYLDRKVALYYDCEGSYYQMAAGKKLAYDGQTSNTGAFDTLLYNQWFQKTGKYGGYENFRMINSMVPRNTLTGEELQFENFETSFNIRFESSDIHRNTAIVGFRQATPGKFTDGWWKINKDQAFVAVTRGGITIAGNDQIKTTRNEEGDMYNNDQVKFDTTLPQEVTIYVKVVGDKVTVKITNIAKSTTYYDNSAAPATVNRTGSGYLAYGLGSGNFNIGEITLARLDANGEVINVNGADSVEDCPWDTAVGRYSETMSGNEDYLEGLYDFYYSAMVNGTPKTTTESLDAHWEQKDGVLVRANDLGGNKTEKLAMLGMKNVKFENFDAIFKLKLDSTQDGTFWVTARQSDATKLGKVVSTPGQEDYVAGQIAVGLSVGGDITIACGDAEPVVIPGRSTGTPSGTYTFRVRVIGNKVEVFLNGQALAARVIANAPTGEGALTFGYSGAALGIASVDVIRLDAHGAAVDMESEYVSVNNPTDQIIVSAGADFDVDIRPFLPATLTVNKVGGGTETMNVFWDENSVDLNVEGDYFVIGYLEGTNGVRAAAPVLVGAYDREITAVYSFDDATALDSFESWFMPTTRDTDLPAIRTEGTEFDGWTITNGRLAQKNTGIRLSKAEYTEGKEIDGVVYQDDRGHAAYASNYSIAVLKDRAYKNFILEVDITANTVWNILGFGAEDWDDPMAVSMTQTKGGTALHAEFNHGKGTGSGKLWDDGKYGAGTFLVDPYHPDVDPVIHVKLVVSDNRVYYYVGDNETPYEYQLSENYNGGYIYFASNQANGGIDNLRITDLDAKEIFITEVISAEPAMQTIDRAAGDSLNIKSSGLLTMLDENGYEYKIPYSMASDTYRSNVNGQHAFHAVYAPYHNIKVADGVTYEAKVDNQINGDFNPNTTVKYYFDHPNDLSDFEAYYSEKSTVRYKDKDYTYYSTYNGDLVKADAPTDRWAIKSDGTVGTSYSFNNGGYSMMSVCKETSTLMLKKELGYNFENYRIEVDYIHGGNFWYQYVVLGQQDPTVFRGELNRNAIEDWGEWLATAKTGEAGFKYDKTAKKSGVWVHIEQEGYFNINGALDGGNTENRFTKDFSTNHIANYFDFAVGKPVEKKHHMVITVNNGLIAVQVDQSDVYYVAADANATGGLLGLAGYGNSGGFDNFQITALDVDGSEIDIDEAPKGWAPVEVPDTYEGWQPTKDEWYFQWGKEYEQ